MLLLVVDENSAFQKKEQYINELHIDGIIHATSLAEAKKILSHVEDTSNIALVISEVLIENIEINENKLKNISENFNGPIILKVHDDLVGLNLMRKKLITDYYLANSDTRLELSRLRQVFKLVSIKQRIINNLSNANQNLKAIEEMKV